MPSVAPSLVLKVQTSRLACCSLGALGGGALLLVEPGSPPPEGLTLPPKPHSLGFHEKDGKAYCRKDYFDMFAPKCGGCTRAILENYISALNTLWHPECFVCRVRSPCPRIWRHPEAGSGKRRAPLTVLSRSNLVASFGLINGVSRQGVHFFKSRGFLGLVTFGRRACEN